MKSPTFQKAADVAGSILSQLCLVHCLFLPFLLSVAPALGFAHGHHDHDHDHGHHGHGHESHATGEWFHLGVLGLATPVALFALWQGYTRHGSYRPMLSGALAMSILWGAFFLEANLAHDIVAALNIVGGFLMASSHWLNWSLTRKSCNCDH